jgi:hypothetical protein
MDVITIGLVDTSHVLVDLNLVLVKHRRDHLLKLVTILRRRDWLGDILRTP